jgi:hypothetical protein
LVKKDTFNGQSKGDYWDQSKNKLKSQNTIKRDQKMDEQIGFDTD